MSRPRSLVAVIVAGLAGVLLSSCSGGDDSALDKAAAPTTSTTNAPPDIPGKKVNKMPPLTGPNAGKGGAGDM